MSETPAIAPAPIELDSAVMWYRTATHEGKQVFDLDPETSLGRLKPPPGKFWLNVASGAHRLGGFTNVDVSGTVGAEVICDVLHDRWPFEDGVVERAMVGNFVEHIGFDEQHPCLTRECAPAGQRRAADVSLDLLSLKTTAAVIRSAATLLHTHTFSPWKHFWGELYRVLDKSRGAASNEVQVVVPAYPDKACWQDPDHKRCLIPETFLYLSRETMARKGCRLTHTMGDYDFQAEAFGHRQSHFLELIVFLHALERKGW